MEKSDKRKIGGRLGCQGTDEFRAMLPAALNFDVSPVEIKEIVYQAVAYLGIGRVFPFLKITNEVFEEKGIELPLPSQTTTTMEDCREAGTQVQVDIFGEGMRDFWKSGPEESRHINRWQQTVLAIIIPVPVWIINSER